MRVEKECVLRRIETREAVRVDKECMSREGVRVETGCE